MSEPTVVENKLTEIINSVYVPKDYGIPLSPMVVDLIKRIHDANEVVGLAAIESILNYVRTMQPNIKLEPNDGLTKQLMLLNDVNNIIKVTDNFNLVYGTLLKIFYDYAHTVFNGRYLYRFTNIMPQKQLKNFTTIMHLLKVTADPVTRPMAKKHVDYDKTLVSYKDNIRSKILGFYGIA